MIDFFFMQALHLNWPLTSRPVAMLHVGLYRATNASIFHSSSINGSAASPYSKLHNLCLYIHIFALGNCSNDCRLFRFLQTLFAPFLKFIRPLPIPPSHRRRGATAVLVRHKPQLKTLFGPSFTSELGCNRRRSTPLSSSYNN